MESNKYKVGKSQWKKWTPKGHYIFNELFHMMSTNEHLFQHPEASLVQKDHWKTTCWNAAWMAADFERTR